MNGRDKKRDVRMYLDACFDLTHYGHANACRLAKQLGDFLIVGIHTDHLITENKGPPVYSEEERYHIARAMRWVDEISENAPYMNNISLLDSLNVDFLVHGDDLSFTADGRDTHEHLRQAGRFRNFKRTEGVSTTDLVGRMLLMTQSHHSQSVPRDTAPVLSQDMDQQTADTFQIPVPMMELIRDFATGRRPKPGDKVVYAPGSFDLLHIGHVKFLEAAAKEGDYLIVGIYPDHVTKEKQGLNFPITSLPERVLNVLSLKCVDDILIGAPEHVTSKLLDQFQIDVVVRGRVSPSGQEQYYKEAATRGNLRTIDSGSDVTTSDIIKRILTHRSQFEKRNSEKLSKDELYRKIAAEKKTMTNNSVLL